MHKITLIEIELFSWWRNNNYVRLNCDYNQRAYQIENCKITSIRKLEKSNIVEIALMIRIGVKNK